MTKKEVIVRTTVGGRTECGEYAKTFYQMNLFKTEPDEYILVKRYVKTGRNSMRYSTYSSGGYSVWSPHKTAAMRKEEIFVE